MSAPQSPGFGVYVHWPFCQAKCPYCDFNSHVRTGVDHAAWSAALCAELGHMAALQDEGGGRPGQARSVFFGGGTPSLMDPSTVEAVLTRIDRLWGLPPDAEITLEANPTSVEAARFTGYRAAGVNRVSIGVQALNDPDLKQLGRLHSADEALQAVALARETFARVSFDLIYARPRQSTGQWTEELRRALGFGPDHLSLYQLTLEPGTPFHALHARGTLTVPDEDTAADMFEATQEICAAAGLPAYEVSNHARPGAESRHNLIYWRSGDYAGAGPGAHGRLTLNGRRMATQALRAPETWLHHIEAQGHGLEACSEVSGADHLLEILMMGLRLSEGVSLARLRSIPNAAFDETALHPLQEGGFIELHNDMLMSTRRGRALLNAVIAELAGAVTSARGRMPAVSG